MCNILQYKLDLSEAESLFIQIKCLEHLKKNLEYNDSVFLSTFCTL